MIKQYEFTLRRTNTSPRQFFSYCRRALAVRGVDLDSWVSFDEWNSPEEIIDEKGFIPFKDGKRIQIIKHKPKDFHLYLENEYNFILRFEFWERKIGEGELYLVKYKNP